MTLESVRAVMETNAYFLGTASKADPNKLYDNSYVDKAAKTVKV
jgi:hypothetical protein